MRQAVTTHAAAEIRVGAMLPQERPGKECLAGILPGRRYFGEPLSQVSCTFPLSRQAIVRQRSGAGREEAFFFFFITSDIHFSRVGHHHHLQLLFIVLRHVCQAPPFSISIHGHFILYQYFHLSVTFTVFFLYVQHSYSPSVVYIFLTSTFRFIFSRLFFFASVYNSHSSL